MCVCVSFEVKTHKKFNKMIISICFSSLELLFLCRTMPRMNLNQKISSIYLFQSQTNFYCNAPKHKINQIKSIQFNNSNKDWYLTKVFYNQPREERLLRSFLPKNNLLAFRLIKTRLASHDSVKIRAAKPLHRLVLVFIKDCNKSAAIK